MKGMRKLKPRTKKVLLIVCIVGACVLHVAFFTKLYWPWVFFPTESSRYELAITQHRWRYKLRPVITITHSINDVHIADYVLTLENGISNLERQSHRLPRLDEGTALVSIELGDRKQSSFTMYFERASDLYEQGLLIHLTSDIGERARIDGIYTYDHHVYIVSGEREVCYLR